METHLITRAMLTDALKYIFKNACINTILPYDEDYDSPISREDSALLISEFIEKSELILQYEPEIPKEYTDLNKISPKNRYAVDLCSMLGLFSAYSDGSLRPFELLTQDEGDRILNIIKEKTEKAKNATGVITCRDMIFEPRIVYSNMASAAKEDHEISSMRFTPYETLPPPYYIGIDHAQSSVSDSAMCFCKICIRSEDMCDPHLVISSPVFSETVFPMEIGKENEYTTLIFSIDDAFRRLRRENLSAENPLASSTHYPLRNIHKKLLNSRYLRLSLFPFGNVEKACADVLYFAFFSDIESAKAYNSAKDELSYTIGENAVAKPNYQLATKEIIDEYNEKIQKRIKEIKETPNILTPDQIKGTCYFISSVNGDDSNDGLSPETAWRSITKLVSVEEGDGFSNPLAHFPSLSHVPKRGDGVFLERGSVFNAELSTEHAGDYVMWLVDGVSYGAYGEGDKPILSCCINYSGSRNWVKTEYDNVWMLDETIELPQFASVPGYNDIANIVITDKNGKTGYGIKVLSTNPENPFNGSKTIFIGLVTNGFDIYESGGIDLTSPGCLRNNLEYFHDWKGKRVYMYCDRGNPGEVFESVVVVKQGIGAYGGSDCVVDNIAFKYIGTFGISVVNIKNLTIQNCTFEWTGGAIQEKSTLFGGAIQNWCNCDGFYIRNCYSDQSLDAAFSTQGGSDEEVIMHDVVIEKCVALHANSSVEIWNVPHTGHLISVKICDNLFGYVGYHFGNRKIFECKDACILQLGNHQGMDLQNIVFERNLCMYASSTCFWARPIRCRGDANGTFLRDNTYILSDRKMFMITSPDMRNDMHDPRRACVPYSNEAAEDLQKLGIDLGSRYYYIDGFAFEGEDYGVYIPPYRVIDRKKRYIPSTLGNKNND